MALTTRFAQLIPAALIAFCLLGCSSLPRVTSSLAFNVAGFGATGDGQTLDTVAFQHAIEAARQSGGATVIVPRGTYLIAPIDLFSGLRLQLAEGAVVKLSDDPALYPLTDTRYNGLMQPARRAGMLADGCSDIVISGGVIEGQGDYWWSRLRAEPTTPIEPTAQATTQPSTAVGLASRPPMLQLRNCRNVRIEGVKFRNPARAAVHVLFSANVTLRAAAFDAPEGSDTTGVEIDSSKTVRIDDCRVAVGDRGVAIEAGRRDTAPNALRPAEDVAVRDSSFTQSNSAIAIGPNVHGGVFRVRVQNSRFDGGENGVLIQTSPDRSGSIQDVRLTDLRMDSTATPLTISLRGKPLAAGPNAAADGVPAIRQVEVSRLTVKNALRAGIIEGLEQSPIRNLRFETLNLSARYGISCTRAADVSFNTVQIATDFGPAILRTDTSNLQIDNWIEATRPVEPPAVAEPAATQTTPATQPES